MRAASKSKTERLQAEAAFQDRRVRNEDGEARDKFYFLAEPAREQYWDALAELRGKRVVVVGCSTGGVTPLARQGNEAIGVDVSPAAIETLREAIQREGLEDRASALVMDAEELDLPPASVDAIVCSGVLHHLNIESACRSWSTVLKPDGQVLMLEPLAWHPAVALYRRQTPSMRTADEHPLVPRDFATLRRHFRTVSWEATALTTVLSLAFAYGPNPLNLRERTHSVLRPLDRLLFSLVPPLRYFAWTAFIRCEGVRRGR